MSRQKTLARVLGALELQSMTQPELECVLSLGHRGAEIALQQLVKLHAVQCVGKQCRGQGNGSGRARKVWGLVS